MSFHDRCVHFDCAKTIQCRSSSRIENRIIFEHDNRSLRSVGRRTTIFENLPAGKRRGFAAFEPDRKAVVSNESRAAVNNDGGLEIGIHRDLTPTSFLPRIFPPPHAGETFYEGCQVPRLFFYAAWRILCRAMLAKW